MRKRKQTVIDTALATPSIPQLLTIPQVAAALGVGKDKVYDLIKHHGLPSVALGSGSKSILRVSVDGLNQWIKQQEKQRSA